MMTGWLPVFHHLNKMTTTQKKCPLCQNDETIAHLFQCQHRHQWRQQLLTNIKDKISKLHMPQQTQQEIVTHIQQVTHNSLSYHHFHHFSVFAGLLPKQWSVQPHMESNPTQHQQWQTTLGNWLIQQGMDLWATRNKKVHEDTTQSTIHRMQNEKIQQLYTLQHDINQHDRGMFHAPIEERYKMSEKQKQKWIEETTKTVQQCMLDHQQKMKEGQKDIRTYFGNTEKSQ